LFLQIHQLETAETSVQTFFALMQYPLMQINS